MDGSAEVPQVDSRCTSPPRLRLEEKKSMAPWSGCQSMIGHHSTSCFALSQTSSVALYVLELDVEGWGCCRPMGSRATRSSTASARGYPCSAYFFYETPIVDGDCIPEHDTAPSCWTSEEKQGPTTMAARQALNSNSYMIIFVL